MKLNSRKLVIQTLVFAAAAGLLFLAASFYNQSKAETPNSQNLPQRTVELRGEMIHVLVAETPREREVGLGGRTGIGPDEGMLFVFEEDGEYSFWMKNMHFSIDILWLSNDGGIVYIAENVAPETYPGAFASTEPARYVLELPAGFVKAHQVAIGDIVRL